MKTENTKPEKCKRCDEKAHIKQGRIFLCRKHYRFAQMKSTARTHGKSVPSNEDLERLLIESDFKCQCCSSDFVWLRKEGNVITLQHDDSGEFKFLCTPCNTKHATSSRDRMYDIKEGEKFCTACNKILPVGNFQKDKYKKEGLRSRCGDCCTIQARKWRVLNKDKYNAYQRKRRAEVKQRQNQ